MNSDVTKQNGFNLMENKAIYVSTMGPKPHHINSFVRSACVLYSTSIVTKIKLELQCKEGMMSGMQASISCLPTPTSSDAPCREERKSLPKLLCGLTMSHDMIFIDTGIAGLSCFGFLHMLKWCAWFCNNSDIWYLKSGVPNQKHNSNWIGLLNMCVVNWK